MTEEQMRKELLYHASLAPFKKLLKDGVILEKEYLIIESVLRMKYSPLFIGKSNQILLDKK